MPEQACYRLEPAPACLNLALDRPEPVPVRPEPAPERPEMIALLEALASLQEAFCPRGWMDGRTNIQIPPVFNRTSSSFGDEAQKGLKNDQ